MELSATDVYFAQSWCTMKPFAWGIQYVLCHYLSNRPIPLICGLVLTNQCNLQCRHCRLASRGNQRLSYRQVTDAIDSYYQEGGRCLYLHGGEPLLWRDSEYGVDEIVSYAHRKGFFTVVIYTNGTLPITTSADTLFVSLDGLQATHDQLRGPSFEKIIDHICRSDHPSIFVNFTINRCNQGEIEDFLSFVHHIRQIRGTFFYFHTPYYGHDELYLEPPNREVILRQLLQYKRRYRILNSRAGLHSALKNDLERPLAACVVYENGNWYRCCRYPKNPELCKNCGYLSYAEIDQTLKLKPSAIYNALKYF